jgi:hypothetical protein
MSQIIEGKDAVVLVMSREEAKLLGSFRFHHVGGDCALYKVLRGLPFKEGGSFDTEESCADGKTIFHDWIPGRAGGAPKPSRSGSVVGRPKPFVTGDFAEPKTKSPDHWIVECNVGVGWEEQWRPSGSRGIAGTKYTSADEAMKAVRSAPWFNLRAHEGRYRAAPVYSAAEAPAPQPKPEP